MINPNPIFYLSYTKFILNISTLPFMTRHETVCSIEHTDINIRTQINKECIK